MKHTAKIVAEFEFLANIRQDINKAKQSNSMTVFLGGDVTDMQWRAQIKHKFADKFSFIDPYDRHWEAKNNIYDECQGMLVADKVIFYRGGSLSQKEQSFLKGLGKKYETFTNINSLTKYLESL